MRGGAVHSYLRANTHQGQSHPWQNESADCRYPLVGVAKTHVVWPMVKVSLSGGARTAPS
jgi:hypothetical protein